MKVVLLSLFIPCPYSISAFPHIPILFSGKGPAHKRFLRSSSSNLLVADDFRLYHISPASRSTNSSSDCLLRNEILWTNCAGPRCGLRRGQEWPSFLLYGMLLLEYQCLLRFHMAHRPSRNPRYHTPCQVAMLSTPDQTMVVESISHMRVVTYRAVEHGTYPNNVNS